jgi:hypothetical protein
MLVVLDDGYAEVESCAIEFLLLDPVVVLQFTLDESEQPLIIFLHDIIDLLLEFSEFSLQLLDDALLFLFCLLSLLLILLQLSLLILIHLLHWFIHPLLAINCHLQNGCLLLLQSTAHHLL